MTDDLIYVVNHQRKIIDSKVLAGGGFVSSLEDIKNSYLTIWKGSTSLRRITLGACWSYCCPSLSSFANRALVQNFLEGVMVASEIKKHFPCW